MYVCVFEAAVLNRGIRVCLQGGSYLSGGEEQAAWK